jgi:hypothetical protein
MSLKNIEQPAIKGGMLPGKQVASNRFIAGAKRSQLRLSHLGYDPIGELVEQYKTIQLEVEYQKKLRSGEIVELNPSTGKPRAYRAEIHHGLLDKLIKISEALLRYGYGRVPETSIVEEKKALPLVVNLTKKGDQYVINDTQPEFDEEFEDD